MVAIGGGASTALEVARAQLSRVHVSEERRLAADGRRGPVDVGALFDVSGTFAEAVCASHRGWEHALAEAEAAAALQGDSKPGDVATAEAQPRMEFCLHRAAREIIRLHLCASQAVICEGSAGGDGVATGGHVASGPLERSEAPAPLAWTPLASLAPDESLRGSAASVATSGINDTDDGTDDEDAAGELRISGDGGDGVDLLRPPDISLSAISGESGGGSRDGVLSGLNLSDSDGPSDAVLDRLEHSVLREEAAWARVGELEEGTVCCLRWFEQCVG